MEISQLDEFLKKENVSICVKDRDHKVLWQNTPCSRLCGSMAGSSCAKGCMEFYQMKERPKHESGNTIEVYLGKKIDGHSFDIVFLRLKEHLISILSPANDNMLQTKVSIEGSGLTSQEYTIAQLMIKGFSNKDIMKKLFISHPTLKTHINHIYKKLGKFIRRS